MNSQSVDFQNVSKVYRLGEKSSNLRNDLSQFIQNKVYRKNSSPSEFHALKDVNFSLGKGEVLGLIGPNGAGKTTILKLLSKITYPSSGTILTEGRVAALIELGAGFHPDLTGRDNIFFNAAILGISQKQAKVLFDRIVDFSGLSKFIDTPIKRYSSGMYVRLAFSIAAHIDCDILLIDEVLAVGDAQFRQRCLQLINDLRAQGTSIIFVSHNLYQVQSVCNRGIFLLGGQIKEDGEINKAIMAYESWMQSAQIASVKERYGDDLHTGSPSAVEIHQVEVINADEPNKPFISGTNAHIKIKYHSQSVISNPNIYFKILQIDGNTCCMVRTADFGIVLADLLGDGVVTISLQPLQLTPGTYCVKAEILEDRHFVVLAERNSDWFEVLGTRVGHEGVYVPNMAWARAENLKDDFMATPTDMDKVNQDFRS